MSSDEDYYDDDDYKEEEDDDDDDGPDSEDEEDYGFDYSAVYDEELTLRPRQIRFSVLSEADILQRQKEAIQDVASVLSIDLSDAATLLRHFKWSVSQVNDEWFQDEERVRKAVGLPSKATATPPAAPATRAGESTAADRSGDAEWPMPCGICFESHASDLMKPALCNEHFFCNSCWKGYVGSAIMDGPGCLNLRCPDPSCGAGVRESFVLDMAPDNLSIKYKRYLLRSYVDDNRNAKWCPAPGCEFAVEFFPDSSNYDITCRCGYHFCWSCLQEAHRPVDCDTVAKWILKNSAESENMNWILANSKACPKCRRPIEKNQGCMHMTCTPPCKYEFCWLCLGAWTEHGEKTGGFYACNRYESARHDGMYDESERRRDMAKSSLEKYTHYYERWAANEQSRVKALESLALMQSTKIEVLSEKQSQPISQLKFVLDAWQQVVECRRVLKWTYAYGYYLPESENAKRQFFEYLQGEADSALENLHKMAEKELSLYIDGCQEGEEAPRPFNDFRSRLAGLTSVTHTYFENLVRALENGLADVEQQEQKQQQQQQQQGAGSSSNTANAKGKKPEANSSGSAAHGVTTRSAAAGTSRHGKGIPSFRGRGPFGGGSSSTGGGSNRGGGGGSAPAGGDEVTHWSCDHCTFANQRGARTCAMCNLPRGAAR